VIHGVNPNLATINTGNFNTINASNIVGYQKELIAGTNITITGNTISSTGGGGGGTLPSDANFSNVNTSTLQASGDVTFSGNLFQPNRVSFLANRIGSNGTYSGGATMIYNNINYNNGTAYSATTGIFTAPFSGTYLFGCSFYTFNQQEVEAQFVVGSNVKEVIRQQNKSNQNNATKITGTCFTILTAGDQFRTRCTQGTVTVLGNPQLINTFYGIFIG
jgi:hypothetical protein